MAQLDKLFHEMIKRGASDLHITCGEAPRLRVDGSMMTLEMDRIESDQMLTILKEIAPEGAWNEFLATNDADFAYAIAGLARFRSNTSKT